MLRNLRLVGAAMAAAASSLGAQAAARPAFLPPVVSPEVGSDGRVTMRLRAPNAQRVFLNLEGTQAVAMQRDTGGVWSHVTAPLAPDIYGYTFNVDGVTIVDPSNPEVKPVFRASTGQSLVHVPGPATLSWEVNDVPRGAVTQRFYTSGLIGDRRDYYVYTPPGYDPRRARPYPVLYLLHGMSDDASGWVKAGRANVILDNLIARRQAEPMLVVMTLGYGVPGIMDGGFWGRRIDTTTIRLNTTRYVDALVGEVVPQVEKAYHVGTSREQRAVAGLSMGGGQSLYAGLTHLDRFAWIGAFSSAVSMVDSDFDRVYPGLDARANERLRLLWIAVGKDDFLYKENLRFRDWLAQKQVKAEFVESAGGHTWMVWRRYLTDFAPRLFRAPTAGR